MTGGAASVSGYGALLRRYRSASGLTQEELAVRSGLSVRAIADMERGRTRRPYHGSVRSLADALALPGPERYQKAASLFGEYGDLHARAVTLGHLGDTRLSAGQPDLAGAAWQQALGLLDDLHHSGAEALRAKLSQLGADREPASRNRDRTGRAGRPARRTRGLANRR